MAISAEQVAYQTAHIHESRRPNVIAAISVLTALSTLAIFLRIHVRWSTGLGFQADDHTIFAAGIVAWLLFVTIYFEASNGLGRHFIAVPEGQLTNMYKGLLFAGPGFHLSILLIQLSFIFLYKRLFTLQRRWFKYTLYALGAFSIVQNLAIIITVLLYCAPFNYYWNKSIPGGHCYKFQTAYIIGLVLNLVTDIAILITPIPIIWGLQMSAKSKKAVTCLFLLGGFVCITNLIRLPYQISIPPEDFTWTNVNAAIWAHASTCIGIVSACLPCYRPLVKDMGFVAGSNRASQPSQSRSKVKAADIYKTLEGQEPSGTGSANSSKIELVSRNHWTAPSHRNKAMAQGPARPGEVETGISRDVIKVTQDVDVTSKEVGPTHFTNSRGSI
ncbi:hypothetical protein MMC07_001927 [Pseudocyphellaria aurata]|nr:hypothetical protein [Pseudocyphellaria aurata]